MLREAGVPTPPASIVEELVGDVVATPATTLAPVTDAVGEVVDTTLGTVDQLGQQVASTSESIAGATGALLETVDETIVDVLDSAGAGQLAATVEPVLDTGTEVTDTTSTLLALTAPH